MNNYLENHVIRFAGVLRSFGLPVGTSETMDALKSLRFIQLTDREQFRSALRATLVKDPVHNPIFDNAFAAFFVTPEVREGQIEEYNGYQDAKEQVKKDLEFQTDELELDEHYLDLYMQLPEEVQNRVKDFIRKTAEGKNVTPKFKPIVENIIKGALNYQRTQMQKPQLIPVESTGEEDLDAVLYQIRAENKEKDIFYRDMDRIDPQEYGETIVLIRKLARRLAVGISRRYRKSRKAHRVDVRRSIRAGIRYGGALMELKYRQKRTQKPEIIFLCDVSGSMLKYSQFTLEFIKGLSDSLPQMKAFIFAESLEKIDLSQFSVEGLRKSANWGEGTNMLAAFQSLRADYSGLLRPAAVLVILSDTKTQFAEPAVRQLEALSSRIKQIVWLNPLPQSQWSKYPTISLFEKHCVMWECSSLAHLAKVLSRNFV